MLLRTTLMLLTLMVTGVACSDDTSSSVDAGRPDTTLSDVGERHDASTDSTVDAAPIDNGVDGMTSDGPSVDMHEGDAKAEFQTDASSVDSTLDTTTPSGPCTRGSAEVLVADQRVGCVTANDVTQCAAAALCGAGWHLCTASEYQAAYADAEPGLSENVWLAGCVREGAAPFAPADHVCASCDSTQGSEVAVGWGCTLSISISTEELNVGVRTSSACSMVGVNESANAAFWQVWQTSKFLSGALCCK
ncbi:MAG: hypothetical protein JRH20_18520 [Deltaproteobacteria bacterium]|nr:hypothetical protein [Deltaproteobacteria bacterium]